MSDEPTDAKDVPTSDGAESIPERRATGRYGQGNFADRLFPGPSRRMSNQRTEHIEGLLRPLDPTAWPNGRSTPASGTPPTGVPTGRRWIPGDGRGPAAVEASIGATSDDLAQVRETLDQQNELLRAILASTVDTQTDARATAQNSRTFAWAGTAIALLTLIATVISVVAVFRS